MRAMGIDLLDVSFRIDREFGVDPRGDELRRIGLSHDPPDVTAGELHDLLCDLIRADGRMVPVDSWERLRSILSEALARDENVIHRESWLVKELGME
jgi:hypothetical protein